MNRLNETLNGNHSTVSKMVRCYMNVSGSQVGCPVPSLSSMDVTFDSRMT